MTRENREGHNRRLERDSVEGQELELTGRRDS